MAIFIYCRECKSTSTLTAKQCGKCGAAFGVECVMDMVNGIQRDVRKCSLLTGGCRQTGSY